jgi:hypothetical protein
MGVGIMRDYTLKQEDLKRLAHTGLRGKTYSKPSPSGLAAGNCRPGQTLKKPNEVGARMTKSMLFFFLPLLGNTRGHVLEEARPRSVNINC